MKKISEIKKELKLAGIEIKKIKATLNGLQAYRVVGRDYDPAVIWTRADIREAYRRGEFV